jgi:hypothetical protein
MNRNSKLPDSDPTARKRGGESQQVPSEEMSSAVPETSHKSGKHSSVEKASASRPESQPAPGAKPKPGSFGSDRSGTTGNAAGLGGRPGEVSGKVRKTKGST